MAYLNMPLMTKAKKITMSGEEQPGNNLFSHSAAASSSRLARLTARIEFGGPRFLIRSLVMETDSL
jgi:hypothetical protein